MMFYLDDDHVVVVTMMLRLEMTMLAMILAVGVMTGWQLAS